VLALSWKSKGSKAEADEGDEANVAWEIRGTELAERVAQPLDNKIKSIAALRVRRSRVRADLT